MREAKGRIGPNAILQFVPVLEAATGATETARLLAQAGITALPDPSAGLIEEGPAARLHQLVRQALPGDAARLAIAAGQATGDYILAHRIPKPAQAVLRHLPARLSVPILSKAIAKHAWTFCGSGEFRLATSWPARFEILDNPVVRGERLLLGAAVAALMAVPVLNLVAPVLGAAAGTHLAQRAIARSGGEQLHA